MTNLKYKLQNHPSEFGGSLAGVVKSVEIDGDTVKTFIPVESTNRDYQDYLAWVAEGNTAEAAD